MSSGHHRFCKKKNPDVRLMFFGLLFLLVSFVHAHSYPIEEPGVCDEWSYATQHLWGSLNCTSTNYCSEGKYGSPVNLRSWKHDPTLPRLQFAGYIAIPQLKLTNNGHSIIASNHANGYFSVESHNNNNDPPIFFQSQDFHFHTHAEEEIQGLDLVASLHMMHYQDPPPEEGKVALSVIGMLFSIGNESQLLKPIFDAIPKLKNIGDTTTVSFPGFQSFLKDIESRKIDGYWNFPGSLTTPPCSEQVDWTILQQKLFISQEQYDALDQLLRSLAHDPPRSNYRKIVRTLDDVAYFDPNYIPPTPTPAQDPHLPLTLTIPIALSVSFFLSTVAVTLLVLFGQKKKQDEDEKSINYT